LTPTFYGAVFLGPRLVKSSDRPVPERSKLQNRQSRKSKNPEIENSKIAKIDRGIFQKSIADRALIYVGIPK